MSEASIYQGWRNTVLGQKITQVAGETNPYGVQCVTLVWDYVHILFPTILLKNSISLGNADTVFANSNPVLFAKVINDHNNVNQLPIQGDIVIFDKTPIKGYTNTFSNPNGHIGICESSSSGGYSLLQQNAPNEGQNINIAEYSWKYRPCIGWLRPKI